MVLALALACLQVPALSLGDHLARLPDSRAPRVRTLAASLVGTHRSAPSDAGLDARVRGLHIAAYNEAQQAIVDNDSARAEQLFRELWVHADDPTIRADARDALVASAAADWPQGFRSRFLASLAPAVLDAAREHHVPPSVTLAQAILESGWGRSGLTARYHNLFGVKAGRSTQRVRLASREYVSSRRGWQRTRGTFRRYESRAASIRDHAALLGTDRRYAHARPLWTDWHAFLTAIAPRYASSPTYVGAVSEIVELYGLDRWDALVAEAVAHDADVVEAGPTDAVAAEVEGDTADTGGLLPLDG